MMDINQSLLVFFFLIFTKCVGDESTVSYPHICNSQSRRRPRECKIQLANPMALPSPTRQKKKRRKNKPGAFSLADCDFGHTEASPRAGILPLVHAELISAEYQSRTFFGAIPAFSSRRAIISHSSTELKEKPQTNETPPAHDESRIFVANPDFMQGGCDRKCRLVDHAL